MLLDILLHFAIGLAGAGATWAVRSACRHTGILPHPRWQLPLVLILVLVEAVFSVWLVG